MGLTRGVINNIENGRKPEITVDQLIAISTVLGVPPVVIALPVDQPYKHVRLTDSVKEGSVERRSFQAVQRFVSTETVRDDSEGSEDTIADQPAAYVASELVRAVMQLRPVRSELFKAKLARENAERIAELEREVEILHRVLTRLGADLTAQAYDGK